MGESQRLLSVTADDMGYSSHRDDGILDSFRVGAVTRSSLMVNGASSADAATKAADAGLPLGLHLNLSEGRPISEPKDVNTLLDERGLFLSIMWPKRLSVADISLEQVEREIDAQICRFEELTGHKPHYVDGHQHVHVLPDLQICACLEFSAIFAGTLAKHSIKETRLPLEPDSAGCSWIEEDVRPAFHRLTRESTLAKPVFVDHGLQFSDAFVGMVTMGKNMSVQALIQIISKAFSEGSHVRSCELMTHPGYRCPPTEGGCGDGPDDFAQSEDREHEMRVLDHHSLKQFYEQNHITKVAYIS